MICINNYYAFHRRLHGKKSKWTRTSCAVHRSFRLSQTQTAIECARIHRLCFARCGFIAVSQRPSAKHCMRLDLVAFRLVRCTNLRWLVMCSCTSLLTSRRSASVLTMHHFHSDTRALQCVRVCFANVFLRFVRSLALSSSQSQSLFHFHFLFLFEE